MTPSITTHPDFMKAARKHSVLWELAFILRLLHWPKEVAEIGVAGERLGTINALDFLDEGEFVVDDTGFWVRGQAAGAHISIHLSSLGMGHGPIHEVRMNISASGGRTPSDAVHRLARQLDVGNALMSIEDRLSKFWASHTTPRDNAREAHAAFIEIGKLAVATERIRNESKVGAP